MEEIYGQINLGRWPFPMDGTRDGMLQLKTLSGEMFTRLTKSLAPNRHTRANSIVNRHVASYSTQVSGRDHDPGFFISALT